MPASRFALTRTSAGIHGGVRFGAVFALGLGVFSCQHFDRTKECRLVTQLVNPVLSQIDVDIHKTPAGAETYRSVAKRYDRLATAVVALRPQNRRVLDAVADYAKLAREAAHDAQAFADALDSKDEGRIAAARAAAARTLKHESGALTHVDNACRTGH